jgi:hypothetical protein
MRLISAAYNEYLSTESLLGLAAQYVQIILIGIVALGRSPPS